MEELLDSKFKYSAAFRTKLRGTGKAMLYHPVSDPLWGIGMEPHEICHPINPTTIKAQNIHGLLLMKTRSKNSQYTPPVPGSNVRNPWKSEVNLTATINKPTVLLVGNSHLKHINTRALSNRCTVSKMDAPTIELAREQILKYEGPQPKCVVVQEITNEAKASGNPKDIANKCVEDVESTLDVIQDRWPECKVIVGLAPPRGDSDRAANIQTNVNSQLSAIGVH